MISGETKLTFDLVYRRHTPIWWWIPETTLWLGRVWHWEPASWDLEDWTPPPASEWWQQREQIPIRRNMGTVFWIGKARNL